LENGSPNAMSKCVQTAAVFCGSQLLTRRLLYH
jgi:hypothetical protein